MNNIAIITSCVETVITFPDVFHDNADYYYFLKNAKYRGKIVNRKKNINFKKAISLFKNRKYSARMNAKIYKILPFHFLPDYEYFVWIDSNFILKENPLVLIKNNLKNNDFAVFRHSFRNCVYKEAKEVIRLKKENAEAIKKQVNFYKKDGYPDNNGLYELACFLFKNTKKNRELMHSWWIQILRYSSRDQISFPYCVYKNNVDLDIIPGKTHFNKTGGDGKYFSREIFVP